jgi:anti-sigma B factor antagonist
MSQTRHGHRPAGSRDKPPASADKLGAKCYVETARVGSASYLVLIGELDLSCNQRFVDALKKLLADDPEDLVLDLRSLTFIDSTGLGLLVKANTLAHQDEVRLHIVRSSIQIVQAVMEASGLDKVLPLVDEPPRRQA